MRYETRDTGHHSEGEHVKIEVVEATEATLSDSPELWVIVQGNEILDLPRVLTWVTEKFPSLWETYDRSRPVFWPKWVSPEEKAETGYRFVNYWVFEKKVTA